MPEQNSTYASRRTERLSGASAGKKSLLALIRRGRMDVPFLLLTLLLLGVGLVMLLSASYPRAYYDALQQGREPVPTQYFNSQLTFTLIGLLAMWLASLVPMKLLHKVSYLALLAATIFLLLVLFSGLTAGGSTRWITIAGQNFQPSELVKAAVVVGFSRLICLFGNRMKTFRYGILPFAAILLVFSVMLLIQPHLSCTIIILLLGAMLMYAGGARTYWFIFAIIAVAVVVILIRQNAEWVVEKAKDNYMLARVGAWLDPYSQSQGDGYQILQSLYAIGSGGLMGLGLGNSRQKYLYLPAAQNDYVFSIICEELGFVGAALILLIFALLILRGYWLALQCRNRYTRLVVIGFTSLLAIQVFLNIGVVTNLLPSTGITLPFFSYGGTALVVQLAEVGVILSASRDIPDK